MTKTRSVLVLSTFVLTLLAAGCGGGEPSAESPAETASPAGAATDAATSEQLTYEPAYPADVSEEGLSEEDVEQLRVEHTHDGGEAHSHEGDEHDHEGEEHSHDDGSHTHGEGDNDDHDH